MGDMVERLEELLKQAGLTPYINLDYFDESTLRTLARALIVDRDAAIADRDRYRALLAAVVRRLGVAMGVCPTCERGEASLVESWHIFHFEHKPDCAWKLAEAALKEEE